MAKWVGPTAGGLFNSPVARLLGAVLVCGIWFPLMFHFMGAIGLLLAAPVAGLAFTRLVIDAAEELGWRMRSAALAGLSGKNYQYMEYRLEILEDEDGCRWIPVDDVRKIVGQLASDNNLEHLYPTGFERIGKQGKNYLRDDALTAHLAHAHSARSIKFKNWVERNVAYPARKTRERRGKYIREATLPRID